MTAIIRTAISVLFSLLIFINVKAQTWSVVTPKPTNSVLWDVFALDANNAWTVGNNATILQWNGTAWVSHSLAPLTSQRFGVWASSSSNVYVVGITTGSQVHRYNGTSWTNITPDIGWGTGSVRSVWGSSANDVWICGGSGKVFHYNGTVWTAKNAGVPASMSSNRVWGTDASNIWLVGSTGADNTGTILKWNAGTQSWITQASTLPAVKAIWGSSPSNMWAAGGTGLGQPGKIFRLTGSSWSDVSPAGSYGSFYHLSGKDASNIWAVGYNGLMYKYNGTAWTAQTSGVATDINAVAAGLSGTGARLWTAGYGDATVNPLRTAVEGVLPLSWQSFTAQPSGNNVLLKWATASEQNTASFEVEHHTGNNNWQVLGSVTAAGNSSQIQQYEFTHYGATTGNNYYRIRQHDINGANTYSKTLRVSAVQNNLKLQLLSNPVKNGMLEIKNSRRQTIRLYDMKGRELKRQFVTEGYQSIDIAGLAAGTYVLAGDEERIPFIVQ